MTNSLNQIIEAALVCGLGFVLATPLLLLNIKIAPRLGLIDWPKARGMADEQVPIIGHSLVLLSLIALLSLNALAQIFPSAFQGYSIPSMGFIVTATILAMMGHFDDRKPIPPLDKMFFQLACASFVVFMDPSIRSSIGERFGTSGNLWAVFFLIALMNAVNFIDGIDGLAGLVLAFGTIGFLALSRGHSSHVPFYAFSLFLIGALGPFLYLNGKRRKGFLGNVGSYFFSYVLGVMHLSLPIEAGGAIARLSLHSLCFVIPAADAMTVITTRLISGRSPFHPDKGHLHHRLIQTSLPLRWVLFNFGVISCLGVAQAFFLVRTEGALDHFLSPITLISFMLITAILAILVERTSKRRVQAYLSLVDAGNTLYCLKYTVNHLDGRPISSQLLSRLEAKMNSEIRVTDICYAEGPHTLVVALNTGIEPLRGITARLDRVFQNEKEPLSVQVEQGELVKVTHVRTAALRSA